MDASPSMSSENQTLIYPGREFPSRPTNEEYYANYANPGQMIIFNQHQFSNSESTRDGTEKDLERLRQTFSEIGYNVSPHTNCKTRDIKQILKEGKVF
jgi:hypothetical protein